MIKSIVEYLNFGLFAELALVMFLLIFLAVVIRTLLMRKDLTDEQARVVLGIEPETNDPSTTEQTDNEQRSPR